MLYIRHPESGIRHPSKSRSTSKSRIIAMTDIEQLQRDAGVRVDLESMPRHIAIIMDGNGRWATKQGLPRVMGHLQGYETVRDIVRAASDIGIKVLTLYTFSTENWRRPQEETEALMQLIEEATRNELPTFHENNVRVRVSGCMTGLPESLQKSLAGDMESTSRNTGLILNLAINYGGRQEILEGVREACRRMSEGRITQEDLTESYFSSLLYTAELPDPDLLIRTAGELRVSNFLLWQIAYSEIWVTSTLWPDFTPVDLVKGIAAYQKRTRKFGAAPPPPG
jgi:undecaprenyl diphosphate synthase